MILILVSQSAFSQRLDWSIIDENESHFGFVGYHGTRGNVATDPSGNIIYCAPFANQIISGTASTAAQFETAIIKRDPNGNLIWQKTLNGSGFKYGHSLTTDSQGNIYLLGWYYGNSSVNGGWLSTYGNYDCFLIKLNSSGNVVYTSTFGSGGYDYPFGVAVNSSGEAFVAGKYNGLYLTSATSAIMGSGNTHFLIKFNGNGSINYMKNICQNSTTDWGKGGINLNSNGKVFVVSNYLNNSSFQQFNLTGSGSTGYTAIINANTGDIENVLKSGTEAWLVSQDPSGFPIVVGLHGQSSDSIGGQAFPALSGSNEWYIAKLRDDGTLLNLRRYKKGNGNFNADEILRSMHVNVAGQVFLSGEFEDSFTSDLGNVVRMELPHASGKSQGVLLKVDESFRLSWYAGVGSRDTLGVPNANFGCGLASDKAGNMFWSTMNFANSVVRTNLVLNTDTFSSASHTSRFAANGIHLWKFSEPFVLTKNPSTNFYCPGDTLSVPYEKFGRFDLGNTFSLEISDSSGSFLQPTTIGSLADTSSGRILATLPLSLEQSTKYRFRVNSSKPDLEGSFSSQAIGIRGKPNADAGPDQYFCLGDTFTIQASGGGSYTWNTDPFLLQEDSAEAYVFPAGDYEFVVRVQDSVSACFNFDSVTTYMRVQVEADSISDTSICFGQELIVPAVLLEGDTNRLSYQWFRNEDTLIGDTGSLYIVGTQSAQYRLVLWDSCSIFRDTQDFHVQVRPPLNLLPVSDTVLCYNTPFSRMPIASGGDSLKHLFTWKNDSTDQFLSSQKDFGQALATDTRLRLVLSDACSPDPDSIQFVVAIHEFPEVQLADTTKVCENDSIQFIAHATSFAPLDYLWPNAGWSSDSTWKSAFTSDQNLEVKVQDQCGYWDSADFHVQVRQSKNLALRSDTLICQGESVQMFVSGSELDTAHYSFYWNDELVPRNYFLVSFDTSRFMKVRMINNCTLAESLDSVWVNVRAPLNINLAADTHYCYGEWITLKVQNSGGYTPNYTNEWKDSEGKIVQTGNQYQVQIKDSLRIVVLLEDACSVLADSLEFFAKTSPPIQIDDQNDTLVCHEQIWQFAPHVSGGKGVYTYSSSPFDSLELANGVAVSQSFVNSIIVRDACSLEDTLSFLVDVRPELSIDLGLDTAICAGDSIWIIPAISGGIASEYRYELEGTLLSNANFYYQSQSDTVLHFLLRDGCSAEAMDSIAINRQDLPSSDFQLLDSVICVPNQIQANSVFVANDAEWFWEIPEIAWDSTTSESILTRFWTLKGEHTLRLRVADSNACSSNWTERKFRGVPYPNATFIPEDTVIEIGQGVKLIVPDQSITRYQWTPLLKQLGHQAFEWTSEDTGSYSIRLLAENQWGCSDTASRTLRVKYPFNCWVPTGFNANKNTNEFPYSPVCSDWAIMDWKVYNRWGQVVYESGESYGAWKGTWRNTDQALPSGVYLIHLRAVNQYGEHIEINETITLIK